VLSLGCGGFERFLLGRVGVRWPGEERKRWWDGLGTILHP
jgi:hypothetical protein